MLSAYYDQLLVNQLSNFSSGFTSPTGLYLAFFTNRFNRYDQIGGAPVEVSGNNYARAPLTFSAWAKGVSVTSAATTFPQASGDWAGIQTVAICDALTNGSIVWYNPVRKFTIPGSAPALSIPAGRIRVALGAGNAISAYYEGIVMDGLCRAGIVPSNPLYLAMFTTRFSKWSNIGDVGVTEVVGNGYARYGPLTFNQWGSGQALSDIDATFPQATGTWGPVLTLALCDAATNGKILWRRQCPAFKVLATQPPWSFPAGTIRVAVG